MHRASIAEVFVAGWSATAAGWLVLAQWPRSNRFHLSLDASHYDALLVLETMRQAAMCINTTDGGYPCDTVFVLTGLDADIDPAATRVGSAPAAVTVELALLTAARRTQVWSARVECDGATVARGTMRARVVLPAVAARARAGATGYADRPEPAAPLAPSLVGRHFEDDVMIGRTSSGAYVLTPNRRHPVFFDHPVDHVPGLLLVDAARQLGYARHDRVAAVRNASAEFVRYVELGTTCELRSRSVAGAIEVTFFQDGRCCGSVRIGTT